MSELPKRLDRLILRLDHMALRVEQALTDSLHAVRTQDVDTAADVDANDSVIDHQEVEIEKECIRLLALYQPAAIDLRRICFIIKVNSDLERIADLACSIARQAPLLASEGIELEQLPLFDSLAELVCQTLSRTLRLLDSTDTQVAESIIAHDRQIDRACHLFVRASLDRERNLPDGIDVVYPLLSIARALERIGDLCQNIAEDVVFLATGEIIRHTPAEEA